MKRPAAKRVAAAAGAGVLFVSLAALASPKQFTPWCTPPNAEGSRHEMHVRHMLSKLDRRSRTEATSKAHELVLTRNHRDALNQATAVHS